MQKGAVGILRNRYDSRTYVCHGRAHAAFEIGYRSVVNLACSAAASMRRMGS